MGTQRPAATEIEYNGYVNYETWCVSLWLSNDEKTNNNTSEQLALYATEQAEHHANVRRQIWPKKRAAVYILADVLKTMVEEATPKLGATMFGDLLNAALSKVEWCDIAEVFLEE